MEAEVKQQAQTQEQAKTEETVEDTKVENAQEPQEELKEEKLEEVVDINKAKKNVHQELLDKVEFNKQRANEAYNKYSSLDKELEEKSLSLIRQENNIIKTTISSSIELLKDLKVEELDNELNSIEEITLDNKEQLMDIEYPSKGSFKSFMAGLFTALIALLASFAIGAKLANLPLTVDTFIKKENWATVSQMYAQLINLKQIPEIGYAVIGGGAFILALIIGKLVSWVQKRKNINYVNRLESEVNEFVEKLEAKNSKISDLIEHIDHIKLVMQKYDIILQEQNAKIRRMLFIEQPQSVEDLQKASQLEVEKTVLILDELLKLMKTPINDDIDIKEESIDSLKHANVVINEVIKKLYI